MTFDEWYESIGQAVTAASPRDLARAAFHAGGASMRERAEALLSERAEEMGVPVISAELHVGLKESPRHALLAWSRGLVLGLARTVGQSGVGGG